MHVSLIIKIAKLSKNAGLTDNTNTI